MLLAALECPVCKSPYVAPVFMCTNGHSICGQCKSNESMVNCPVCRCNFTDRRNHAVEQIMATGITDIDLESNEETRNQQFDELVSERVTGITNELGKHATNSTKDDRLIIQSMLTELTKANLAKAQEEIFNISSSLSIAELNVSDFQKRLLELERELENEKTMLSVSECERSILAEKVRSIKLRMYDLLFGADIVQTLQEQSEENIIVT